MDNSKNNLIKKLENSIEALTKEQVIYRHKREVPLQLIVMLLSLSFAFFSSIMLRNSIIECVLLGVSLIVFTVTMLSDLFVRHAWIEESQCEKVLAVFNRHEELRGVHEKIKRMDRQICQLEFKAIMSLDYKMTRLKRKERVNSASETLYGKKFSK